MQEVVESHIVDALDSYGGNIEIRSDEYGESMRGKMVSIKEVFLVYDAAKVPPNTQAAIKRLAKAFADGYPTPNNVRLTVMFK